MHISACVWVLVSRNSPSLNLRHLEFNYLSCFLCGIPIVWSLVGLLCIQNNRWLPLIFTLNYKEQHKTNMADQMNYHVKYETRAWANKYLIVRWFVYLAILFCALCRKPYTSLKLSKHQMALCYQQTDCSLPSELNFPQFHYTLMRFCFASPSYWPALLHFMHKFSAQIHTHIPSVSFSFSLAPKVTNNKTHNVEGWEWSDTDEPQDKKYCNIEIKTQWFSFRRSDGVVVCAESKVLALFNPCYGNSIASYTQRQTNRTSNPNQFERNDLLVVVYGAWSFMLLSLFTQFHSVLCPFFSPLFLLFYLLFLFMHKIRMQHNKRVRARTHHIKSAW